MPVRRQATPLVKALVVIVGLGLIALLVHTIYGEGGYMDLRRQLAELEELRQRTETLEEENRRLMEEIKDLRDNPDAIERVARENLKMAKPGETIITIPEKEKAPPANE